jgi:hypothetical protein
MRESGGLIAQAVILACSDQNKALMYRDEGEGRVRSAYCRECRGMHEEETQSLDVPFQVTCSETPLKSIFISIMALRIKCSKKPLLTVQRSNQWRPRLVYILVANKTFKYSNGRKSKIIYIGTTGKGAGRPAISAVNKASKAFELRGVKTVEVHLVTCTARKSVKTWLHLESSLLASFAGRYFKLPPFNRKKGSIRYAEDVILFRRNALESTLLQFGN